MLVITFPSFILQRLPFLSSSSSSYPKTHNHRLRQRIFSVVLALVNATTLSKQVHNSLSAMPYNTIITKTTNKGKVLEFEIDVGLRDDMRRSIRDRIIYNLEATKRFLELGEDYKDIYAEVYTYAVEEYGKILS
jgi:hypothetical protein